MVELLDSLRSRFVFVVGKGGVGKTTAAGAVGLSLAHSGVPTRLLSIDPAHSIGDLFQEELEGGSPEPSRWEPGLILEELDAHAWTRSWISSIRDPIADLFDRATYLDRADIDAFLDVSLPGLDEVAAALRLCELEADGDGRIVVDTAPTGHTLRLFDCARVVASWARTLDVMVEKASVIGSFLTGHKVRLAAEDVLDGLRERSRRFQEGVLRDADVVVVTRPEVVVRNETHELVRGLRARGMSVAAVVSVGAERGFPARPSPSQSGGCRPGYFVVPELSETTGRRGLRRWSRSVEQVTEAEWNTGAGTGRSATGEGVAAEELPTGEPGRAPPSTPSDLRSLLDRDLLFFAGKGGVGKSTCASAAAVALAAERPVQLLSTDPAGSLSDLFGVDVTESGLEVTPDLVARQVDGERAFARFKGRYREGVADVFARIGLGETAALDRKILESLLDLAPPGIDEMVALQQMLDWSAERGEEDPMLVVDAAPTGHFLRLLEMPELALSWIRAAMEIVIRYRAALGLDELAVELVRLSRMLRELAAELRDETRAGVVVVTVPEALVERETERLVSALGSQGISVAATIVNRSASTRFPRSSPSSSPLVRSPSVSPSPRGVGALSDFFGRWERVS